MTEFSHDLDYEPIVEHGALAINGSLLHASFKPAGTAKPLRGNVV
jgi:hypothetical protein